MWWVRPEVLIPGFIKWRKADVCECFVPSWRTSWCDFYQYHVVLLITQLYRTDGQEVPRQGLGSTPGHVSESVHFLHEVRLLNGRWCPTGADNRWANSPPVFSSNRGLLNSTVSLRLYALTHGPFVLYLCPTELPNDYVTCVKTSSDGFGAALYFQPWGLPQSCVMSAEGRNDPVLNQCAINECLSGSR